MPGYLLAGVPVSFRRLSPSNGHRNGILGARTPHDFYFGFWLACDAALVEVNVGFGGVRRAARSGKGGYGHCKEPFDRPGLPRDNHAETIVADRPGPVGGPRRRRTGPYLNSGRWSQDKARRLCRLSRRSPALLVKCPMSSVLVSFGQHAGGYIKRTSFRHLSIFIICRRISKRDRDISFSYTGRAVCRLNYYEQQWSRTSTIC